jgi:glycosyltransferase involved in cell wall biosynthesis
MHVLMIGQDTSLILKKDTIFPRVVNELLNYWDKITIICPRLGNYEPLILKRLEVYPIGFNPIRIIKFISNLYKKNGFDLIITQDPLRCGFNGQLISKKLNIPVIMELHSNYLDNIYWLSEKYSNKIWNILAKKILKKADKIRAVNNNIYQYLISNGIKYEKIFLIPAIYVDTSLFSPDQELPFNTILTVCRLIKAKGIPLLLRSFKLVLNEIKDAQLIIVGNGPEENYLMNLARNLAISKNVKFIKEFFPWPKLVEIYRKASVFTVTSYYEGGPRVAFEAMACEVPIVTTNVGLLSEVIQNGKEGFIVDRDPIKFSEKIVEILSNETLRKIMGKNGRNLVKEKFEWKKSIRTYAKTYAKFIEEHKNEI